MCFAFPRVTRAMRAAPHTAVRQSRGITIVVTPGSGNGRAPERAGALHDGLAHRGHRATVELFSDLETLRAWAPGGDTRCSMLVCIGGDGTLCAGAGAALRRSVPFLPIPSGFGNLFARALGQPRRVENVIQLIARLAASAGLAFTLVRRARQLVWIGLGAAILLAMRPARGVLSEEARPAA